MPSTVKSEFVDESIAMIVKKLASSVGDDGSVKIDYNLMVVLAAKWLKRCLHFPVTTQNFF